MFRRRAYTTDRSEIIFVLVPHILPQGFVPEPWQGHGELVNNSQHLPKIQFNQQFGPGYNVNSQSDCGVAPPAPEQTAQPQSQHIMVPAEQNLHLNHQQQLRQPYQQQWQPRPHQQFRREQIQAPLYYPTSNHRPQQPLPRAQPTQVRAIQRNG